jgi:nitrous oxide reductase accessory protein NosL
MTKTFSLIVLFLFVSCTPKIFCAENQSHCAMCGMDIENSEVPYLIVCKTGGNKLTCGINCAVLFGKKEGKNIVTIKARNYNTKKWIEVNEAFYVDGSKQIPRGTMYPPVWPFASKKEAKEFVNRHGGSILTFEEISKILPCNVESKRNN